MMTKDEVLKRVEEIKRMSGDPEFAHIYEDDLWRDVLEAIANGHPNAATLADLALGTTSIDFPRWYA